MAFGQASGPPATHRQLGELLTLLNDAGHTDFRDARGPMGFTQRQGNGKFTRDEADAFIEQLMAEAEAGDAGDAATDAPGRAERPAATRAPRAPVTAAERKVAAQRREAHKMPSDVLAAELQQRGWAVIEP